MDTISTTEQADVEPTPAPADRRGEARVPVNLALLVEVVDDGMTVTGRARDLTRYSMSLHSDHRFRPGAVLRLVFSWPELGDQPIRVRGVVVHHRAGAGAGVRYVDFKEADLSALWQVVEARGAAA